MEVYLVQSTRNVPILIPVEKWLKADNAYFNERFFPRQERIVPKDVCIQRENA